MGKRKEGKETGRYSGRERGSEEEGTQKFSTGGGGSRGVVVGGGGGSVLLSDALGKG